MQAAVAVLAALLTLLAAAGVPEPATGRTGSDHTGVRVEEGVVYATGAVEGGLRDLQMDVYWPTGATGEPLATDRPAVVLLHGGGFRKGARDDRPLREWATHLAEHGIVAASIDYRLIPDRPVATTPALHDHLATLRPHDTPERITALGAAMEDAAAAARWLLAAGVDLDRIVYGGSSAGAIAALNVSHAGAQLDVDWLRPRAVLSLWGSFGSMHPDGERWLRADGPALWLIHGTADRTVPFEAALQIFRRARDLDVHVEMHAVPGARHGYGQVGFLEGAAASGVSFLDEQARFVWAATTRR